ncbi:endonuclease 8-like 1 [Saccostrea echinata]|uniref:endonuclease 8-like 1 n=1 Tax=Saccostrea echinata TaxID=191078 RepID=UPI002A81044E|nr:endonuclease 8-like 1 [Saccostrea echinata]
MPEGPELHLASKFVNLVCKGRLFKGPIIKSEVSKHADVEFEDEYTISATSRGKEMKLTLNTICEDKKSLSKSRSLDIVFQFGMSGKFDFYEATELKKHAHLNFFTKDEPRMVLSFVDYRRFGKWQVGGEWSKERGPCVMFEYQAFRKNVLDNVKHSVFNKPICEFLLNQTYFNGIGNYLRAEILYRAGIPPFVSARSVLEPLCDEVSENSEKLRLKTETPDILQLCHILPQEVINLGGTGYDPEGRDPDYSKFSEWLQCYYKEGMDNMADHNKRTIWFHGNPGPLVPKEITVRGLKRNSKVAKNNAKKMKKDTESEQSEVENGGSETVTRRKLQEAEDRDAKQKTVKSSRKSSAKSLKTLSNKSRKFDSPSDLGKNESAHIRKIVKTVEEKDLNQKKSKSSITEKSSASKIVVNGDSNTLKAKVLQKGRKRRATPNSVIVKSDSIGQKHTTPGDRRSKSSVSILNGRSVVDGTPKSVRQRSERAARARRRYQR